jgi:hypothetical protein
MQQPQAHVARRKVVTRETAVKLGIPAGDLEWFHGELRYKGAPVEGVEKIPKPRKNQRHR